MEVQDFWKKYDEIVNRIYEYVNDDTATDNEILLLGTYLLTEKNRIELEKVLDPKEKYS